MIASFNPRYVLTAPDGVSYSTCHKPFYLLQTNFSVAPAAAPRFRCSICVYKDAATAGGVRARESETTTIGWTEAEDGKWRASFVAKYWA